MKEISQEITPITKEELFIIMDHTDAKFDYPLHCHPEYEINLVIGTDGTRRIGEHVEDFSNLDLVLTGPYVPHVWKSDKKRNHTITIQFASDLKEFNIMEKRPFSPIKQLLEESNCGLKFTGGDAVRIKDKILALTSLRGFESGLAFLDILNTMAESKPERLTDAFNPNLIVRQAKSRRISRVCKHIEEHLNEEISLSDVAALANMSESAFSHFFKKHTRISFKTYLTNMRIAKACNLLASTTLTASEICYECGFNNKSNFIRIFTKNKKMTPIAYRNYISDLIV